MKKSILFGLVLILLLIGCGEKAPKINEKAMRSIFGMKWGIPADLLKIGLKGRAKYNSLLFTETLNSAIVTDLEISEVLKVSEAIFLFKSQKKDLIFKEENYKDFFLKTVHFYFPKKRFDGLYEILKDKYGGPSEKKFQDNVKIAIWVSEKDRMIIMSEKSWDHRSIVIFAPYEKEEDTKISTWEKSFHPKSKL